METIIKAIKELMMYALFGVLFGGTLLFFVRLLMAVSYQGENGMEELNELIESLMIDVAEEGIGTTAGIGLMWGLFFGGAFMLFQGLLELLASTV